MSSNDVPTGPCIVLDPETSEEGRTILLDTKGNHHTCNIKPFRGNMSFSRTWKGWILSWDRNDFHTFLYDPWTREEIGLPRFTHDLPRVFDCALSDKPTNPGCIVVILHPDEPYFWYCRIGGVSEWIKYDYDVGMDPADPKGLTWKNSVLHTLRSCNGRFYFPIASVKHGIIEFKPNPVIRIVTMHGFRGGYYANVCNFELDEELYKFYVFYDNKDNVTDFSLYKVDLVQQRFIKTLVAPFAAVAHTMHRPFQWNMSTVQRYTGMSLTSAVASELRNAPRCPLGLDVVPDV
nr:unnamed protein product [Digitaria exilis]